MAHFFRVEDAVATIITNEQDVEVARFNLNLIDGRKAYSGYLDTVAQNGDNLTCLSTGQVIVGTIGGLIASVTYPLA